jgi:hypothetical protein
LAAAPRDPEPLHARIDRVVASRLDAPAAAADDAEFLRRVWLDLAGMIPAASEARSFLDDPAPDKRAGLIDRLLASPEHARHMAVTLDVMLMERRADKHVKTPEWRAWLLEAYAAGRPYTAIVRDILAADGSDEKVRPAARFTLDREAEPHALTRDVGRIFLGRDLQCAQCHDHPRYDDYYQRDYFGIYSFFSGSSLFQPDAKKPALLAEKAGGEAAFKSVFTNVEGKTGPRLPGEPDLAEPVFPAGQEYVVAPDPKNKAVRSVPKHSRRVLLGEILGSGSNRDFALNLANRLWGHMMGRALVEPVDLFHAKNPATHPELLDLLAGGLVALEYDLRAFLRELALTTTYQRRFDLPADLAERARAAAARLPGLEAELAKIEAAVARAGEACAEASSRVDSAIADAQQAALELRRADSALTDAWTATSPDREIRDAIARALAHQREQHRLLLVAGRTAEAGRIVPEIAAVERLLAARPGAGRVAAAASAAQTAEERWDGACREIKAARDRLRRAESRRDVERQSARRLARAVEDAKAVMEGAALYAVAKASDAAADALESQLAEAREAKTADAAGLETRLAEARSRAEADQSKLSRSLEKLTSHWTEDYAVGALAPLTPEQLAWSMMQATGVAARERAAAEAEFEKKKPAADRGRFVEQWLQDKLAANVAPFVTLFGGTPGQPQDEFYASADQALFLKNGGMVLGWLAPAAGNLADRLSKLEDPKALAEELFLSALTRRPTGEETRDVARFLESRGGDRAGAVQDLAWALLTSIEFRFKR